MLRLGIVGLGVMGRIHVRHLKNLSDRVTITSVFDPSPSACADVVSETGASIAPDALSVVSSGEVDAILVASPAEFHSDLVLASIEAGKPVFCEKPLVVNADQHSALTTLLGNPGEQLVWAGFMRRYDPAFVRLKNQLAEGTIGQPVFIDMSHRNPSVPPTFGNDAYMNETFIHEFDVLQWLTSEAVIAIRLDHLGPECNTAGLNDPQFLTAFTQSGVACRISGHITNNYGYDIRCEVVGQEGSLMIGSGATQIGVGAVSEVPIMFSWGERFRSAYESIIDAWISDLERGTHTGVSLRDALGASSVALAGIRGLASVGEIVEV